MIEDPSLGHTVLELCVRPLNPRSVRYQLRHYACRYNPCSWLCCLGCIRILYRVSLPDQRIISDLLIWLYEIYMIVSWFYHFGIHLTLEYAILRFLDHGPHMVYLPPGHRHHMYMNFRVMGARKAFKVSDQYCITLHAILVVNSSYRYLLTS